MKPIYVIGLAVAAVFITGCNMSAAPASTSPESVSQPILDGSPIQVPSGCVPLTQTLAFSGTATLSASTAVSDEGSQGRLSPGVVSSVTNTGGSDTAYDGTSDDGEIQFSAQPGSGSLSNVQGTLQFSDAAWSQAVSQLGGSQGQCVQSMTFNLEVSDSGSGSAQTLYGGQVVLTVSGTQITLAF